MSLQHYLGWVWIAAVIGFGIWAVASAITYFSNRIDRTRVRLLITAVIATTALIFLDIARLRFKWAVFGIAPDSNAPGIAVYRTAWVVLLYVTTWVLYSGRFRSWVGRRRG